MVSRQHPQRSPRFGTSSHSRVRIIGGRWRGVPVSFPALPQLRPTPDRVRETLFNWLQPIIAGTRCLDLFAGSGVLGIEALSRGAARVSFVDRDPQIGKHLVRVLEQLGVTQASVDVADACSFLQAQAQPYDIVFLDPPYAAAILQPICQRLAADGWLAPGAYIYLECAAQTGLPPLPANWLMHRAKRAGQVSYHLLRTPPLEA